MKRNYCWTWKPEDGEGDIPRRLPPEEREEWETEYRAYTAFKRTVTQLEDRLQETKDMLSRIEERLYQLHCLQCQYDCGLHEKKHA